MKFRAALVLLLLFSATRMVYPQSMLNKYSVVPDPIVCYASPEVRKSFVGPPDAFLFRQKSAGTGADIIVNYIGFPDSVRVAFEYAVSIWESLISSSVPIYVEARWQVLGTNVLGSCGPSDFLRNFDGAPLRNVYYPIALAEKLQKRQITGPGSPDMVARFSSSIPWYTGIDGKTPVNRYDFVSTVLHEIAHGLGFTGFFSVNAARLLGSSGAANKNPAVFDTKVQDFQQRFLTDEFYYPNPSEALYNAFISNLLYSDSYLGRRWNNNSRPRLYAPSKFSDGSSIYHLNTISYPYGSPNSLMTHSAGLGQAIHSPGPLALGILYDMGWKHLTFHFTAVKDREKISGPIPFATSIDSESGLDSSLVYLIYSTDGFKAARDSVRLIFNAGQQNFAGEIMPEIPEGQISYYLSASDSSGRMFYFPIDYPERVLTLNIGRDTIPPVIAHTPPSFILSVENSYLLEAVITDNVEVDTAIVALYSEGNETARIPLVKSGNDLYQAKLKLAEYGLENGGTLEYRIIATDMAEIANQAVSPGDTSSHKVLVEFIMKPSNGYFTDFNGGASDFIQGDFKIKQAKNFDNPALHSPNPYPSPEKDNAHFNLMTMLRVPIIVKDKGSISYDEVVLVEPGEAGTLYGDEEFWDYVIVEASRDSGKNWLPLTDGYDSGANITWLNLYNSSITGQNSTAEGTKDQFINRQFTLTGKGNFKEGDTILIRFRLYSDPYANGWGWAIDNLRIQQPVSAGFAPYLSPGHIQFWPNPFKDRLHWSYSAEREIMELDFEIYDLSGRMVRKIQVGPVSPGMSSQIATDDIPLGFCIISVIADRIPISRFKLLRH